MLASFCLTTSYTERERERESLNVKKKKNLKANSEAVMCLSPAHKRRIWTYMEHKVNVKFSQIYS